MAPPILPDGIESFDLNHVWAGPTAGEVSASTFYFGAESGGHSKSFMALVLIETVYFPFFYISGLLLNG